MIQYLAFKIMFSRGLSRRYIKDVIEYLENQHYLDESVQFYIIKERPEFFEDIKHPTEKAQRFYQSHLDEL